MMLRKEIDRPEKVKGAMTLIVLVFILAIMGMGCNTRDAEVEEAIVYENERLGFSLEFPGDWKDKYIIEESDHSIIVLNKKVKNELGAGTLFTVQRITGELITEEDMKQAPVSQQIILQGNGYTYFSRLPSDVQYPSDNEELSQDYLSMTEDIDQITKSISLWGEQNPPAANEGYKVVGSSFFIVEIPEAWELKSSTPDWELYSTEDNKVGTIQLIPYRTGEESTTDDHLLREYLYDDQAFREIVITLDSQFADTGTMEKIAASLEFAQGPFNVVDFQYNAEQYISKGGSKVFGKIEDIVLENGKAVAVRVHTLRLFKNDATEQYPNGIHIEDLNEVKDYSLTAGVSIAPLLAPNYNSYGFYEVMALDENFIKKYNNYQDFFYDFIVGSDGQLKIILGHYIP